MRTFSARTRGGGGQESNLVVMGTLAYATVRRKTVRSATVRRETVRRATMGLVRITSCIQISMEAILACQPARSTE